MDGAVGDQVGSVQADGFGSHDHGFNADIGGGGSVPSLGFGSAASLPLRSGTNWSGPVNYNGGNETRPKNANAQYVIAYI